MKTPTFILHQPSHPGNIGATARAMKTMSLGQLSLVTPHAPLNDEAYQRASHATSVLDEAISHPSLQEACQSMHWTVACTARPRNRPWPVLTPKEAAQKAFDLCQSGQNVAFIFGSERTGLANEDLQYAQAIVEIPTNPDYRSLNLAQAVQILAYEYAGTTGSDTPKEDDRATQGDLQHLFDHFHQTLARLDFFPHGNPEHTMSKLICLLNRAELKADEVALLRGLLTAMDKHQKDAT